MAMRGNVKPNITPVAELVFWMVCYVMLVGYLQSQIPYPLDKDSAYHAVVGQLTSKYGILHSFPWTPFSTMADQYADKEFLLHMLFVPFSGLDWRTASQVVGTLAGSGILLAMYLVLRVENVPFAGLWALIPLTSSVAFIFRFALVRPHLLAIMLSLIFLWAAARNRLIVLSVVAVTFPLAYVAFWQIPLLLLIACESARFLSGNRPQWKPTAVVAVSILVGLAVHPNTINLLRVNWMHMAEVLFKSSWGGRVGFDLGAEFAPYPLAGWIQGLLFNVVMVIAASVVAWRSRRDLISLCFALAALGFCVLTIKSARFAEYFVPFSVAAFALSLRSSSKRLVHSFLPAAILVITVGWMGWVQPNLLENWRSLPDDMPPDIAATLQWYIPVGGKVFTPDWEFTGLLMLTLPDRYFMVQLDPTFFYMKNPKLYHLWYRICHEAPSGSAQLIRQEFGSRYVLGFNRPRWKKLFDLLSQEPGVRELLLSDTWVLFDLGR